MVYHKLDHETTNAQNNRYKKNHILIYILIYVPCFKLHIILCLKKCSSDNLIKEVHIDDHLKGTLEDQMHYKRKKSTCPPNVWRLLHLVNYKTMYSTP